MALLLYVDVHVRSEITRGLVARGVDVLTAQQDGTGALDDPALLDRATTLGRVLFSQDSDLLAEAVLRQREARRFAGVAYAHQLGITIGQCIDDLELMAKVMEPMEMVDRIVYLPLK